MSGAISHAFVDNLLSRVDIVALIGGRVSLKKAGKDFQGLCPFHEEKTPSFSVVPAKDMYYCFGCGAGGDAIKFLQEYDGLSFAEAVETLAASVGLEVPRQRSAAPQRDLRPLYDAMRIAEGYYRAQLKRAPQAIEYLERRGLTGEAAQTFGLGYATQAWDGLFSALSGGDASISADVLLEAGLIGRNEQGKEYDRFRHRIMFPVRDIKGRIVAFGGRLLGDGEGPKYLNSPETPIFHKSHELYGLFEARRATRQLRSLIVVEGYMDVIALVQAGISNVVATLGTATGEGHYQKLYRYVDQVVCCFDGDQAGRRAANKALEGALPSLSGSRGLKLMLLPEGEDPDTMVRSRGAPDFRHRLDQATPAIEHLFTELGKGLDLDAIDDRARLADLAAPYINRAPADSLLRRMMRDHLAKLTGLADDADRDAQGIAAVQGAGAPVPRQARPSGLGQRMLALLLKMPTLAAELEAQALDALAEAQSSPLGAEVVRYAAQHKDLDPTRLLGRWAGQEGHSELVQLHQAPAMLDAEAMALEFKDGMERLLALRRRRRRMEMREQMRENPSAEKEKLAEFLALRLGG